MTNFLQPKDLVIILLLLLLGGLYVSLSLKKGENEVNKQKIINFEQILSKNQSDFEQKETKFKEKVKEIEAARESKIKIVKEFIYDKNKSTCENAIAALRLTF